MGRFNPRLTRHGRGETSRRGVGGGGRLRLRLLSVWSRSDAAAARRHRKLFCRGVSGGAFACLHDFRGEIQAQGCALLIGVVPAGVASR